jgi:hypothetical protein
MATKLACVLVQKVLWWGMVQLQQVGHMYWWYFSIQIIICCRQGGREGGRETDKRQREGDR